MQLHRITVSRARPLARSTARGRDSLRPDQDTAYPAVQGPVAKDAVVLLAEPNANAVMLEADPLQQHPALPRGVPAGEICLYALLLRVKAPIDYG